MKLEKLNRRRVNLIPWNKSLMSYLTYIWILSSKTTGDRKEWKTFGKSYLVTSVLKSIWMYRDWPKLWLLVSIWILEIPNAVVRRLHGRSITLFSTYIVFIRNIVESSSMKTKFDRKRHIQREEHCMSLVVRYCRCCCCCCCALENVQSLYFSISFQWKGRMQLFPLFLSHIHSLPYATALVLYCSLCVFPSNENVNIHATVRVYHSRSLTRPFSLYLTHFCPFSLVFVYLCHVQVLATDFLISCDRLEFSTSLEFFKFSSF